MNRSNRTGLLLALCGLALSPAAFAQKHDMHAMMDSDGNGAISAAEHAAAAQKMFAKADANGDGSLGADEMKAMHQQMMGGHGDKACDCACCNKKAGEAPPASASHADHH